MGGREGGREGGACSVGRTVDRGRRFSPSFRSVVVITFASHAKGPRFETGRKQGLFPFFPKYVAFLEKSIYLKKLCTPPFLVSLAPGCEATLLKVGPEPAAPEADTRIARGRTGLSPALQGGPTPAAPEAHPRLAFLFPAAPSSGRLFAGPLSAPALPQPRAPARQARSWQPRAPHTAARLG